MNTVQRLPKSTGAFAYRASFKNLSRRTFIDQAIPERSAPQPLEHASFNTTFPTSLTAIHNEEAGGYEAHNNSLSADYPTLSALTYRGRVSVVNVDNLLSAAESYYALIVSDPLSSSLLYRRTGSRIVMDERDAVGAVSLESVISVHYDWDRMIRSGFTPYYTFSVLHQ